MLITRNMRVAARPGWTGKVVSFRGAWCTIRWDVGSPSPTRTQEVLLRDLGVRYGIAYFVSDSGGPRCQYCGGPDGGRHHTVHRDGFGVGPEVPLCDDCGMHEAPSLSEIWSRIARVVRAS